MVIASVSRQEVMMTTRRLLGLPLDGDVLDDALLAALLRRSSGILCPCSPATLASTVAASLKGLADNHDTLVKRLSFLTETLMIYGDLLELNHSTTADAAANGTRVFAAPPSFAEGPGGIIFVLGTARDEITPQPASLSARIEHRGALRILRPHPGEDLPAMLRDLGFLHLAQSIWLKTPKLQSAADFRGSMSARLALQPPSGDIQDLSILDAEAPADYYSDRWRAPRSDTGEFVARRPQAYGAPIWGYASLSDGKPIKFLDLPFGNMPWRGCDIAWHLQMAIDACRGMPQHYRLRRTEQGHSLDFFSPLPIWAHRRMTVVGSQGPREKCLLAFQVTEQEYQSERMFLQQQLWLSPRD